MLMVDGTPIKWATADFPIATFFDHDIDQRVIRCYRDVSAEFNVAVGCTLFDLGIKWGYGLDQVILGRALKIITAREWIVKGYGGSVSVRTQYARIVAATLEVRTDISDKELESLMKLGLECSLGVLTDSRELISIYNSIDIPLITDKHFDESTVNTLKHLYNIGMQ